MKLRIPFFVVIGLMFFACTREAGEPAPVPGPLPVSAPGSSSSMTIQAGFYAGEGSKTILQDGGPKVFWEPADEIKLFSNGTGARFIAQNDAPAAVATFSGTASVVIGQDTSVDLWGLYPYRDDATSDGVSVSTTLPAEQTGRAGSFARDTHISIARSASSSLTFYNVTGGIRFSLTQAGVKTVTFEGSNGEPLAGRIKVSFDGGVPIVQELTDGQTSLTLAAPDGGTFQTGTWYYIDALPATLSGGFRMVFRRDDDSATLSSGTAVTIKRGVYGSIANADSGLKYLSEKEAERLARLGQTPIVACYFTEYTKSANFPKLADVRCFTHINIGHARFVNKETGDGGLEIKSPGGSYMQKLAAFKKDYPELKLLLMIGGWGKNADGFSQMARDPDKRALFCSECVRLCNKYNLDGVDIDWEYPTYSAKTKLDDGTYYYNGADPSDTKNFVTLAKELREALGKDRLISYAASDSGGYIDNKSMLEYVDYINVMTYSMGDPPYHNSPLYRSSLTRKRSGQESIEIYHKQGVPYDRMNYGIGFYGHGDGTVYPSSVQYYLAVEALTKGTANGKSVAGYNIRHWDDTGKNCYLGDANGKMYASYEDAESIGYRVDYVKQTGLLGAFAWEYREDTPEGTLRYALHDLMAQ